MTEETKDKLASLILWIIGLTAIGLLVAFAITAFTINPIAMMVFIGTFLMVILFMWAISRKFDSL